MPQLPNKITKKEEREKLIFLSKQVCQKMDNLPDISGLIDTATFKKFNGYIDSICNFTDQFKISEFTKNIFDIGETVKKLNIPSINYLPQSNYSQTNTNNYKDIKELEDKINDLKKEIALYESKESNFGIKINIIGNFFYKNKLLKISTDSNVGKFLKYVIENKDHFISDEYCKNEFNCPTSKEITYIIRDLNKTYLSKNSIKAKMRRCRDAKGYTLEGIIETKS